MKRYLKFVAPFISILILFMLILFKTIPTGKLWKGYNILYVPVETQDTVVQKIFSELNIDEHFELSGQYLPLLFSAYSPEISMLKLNSSESTFKYLTQRNAYFFDKANNYRLYYISAEYKNKLSECVKLLSKQNIKAGIDGSASYPFLIPVISIILFVVLAFYSKHKIIFCCSGSLLLVYIFCNPFYSCAVAMCLMLLCLFFMSNVWNRKNFALYLLGNFSIPALMFFSLVGAFAGSVKSGFMFLIALAGVASVIYTLFIWEKFILSKRSFVPVAIRPVKRVSIYGGKISQTLISTICSVLFLFAISFISSNTSINYNSAKLMLPSAESGSSDLVNLEDYYNFVWNVSSYPYKNINKKSADDYFEYPRYEEANGKIIEKMYIKAFNESFKLETYDSIDLLQFNSIEKLLKTQGSEVKPGYASSGSYHTGIFAIIMMLVSFNILLFIYISSIIRKGIRK